MLKKRKVVVYLVLALVLITQTAFSGSEKDPERSVAADVASDQDTNDTANKSDESDPEDNKDENATVSLNVIYKNSLASSKETTNSNKDEGDFVNKVISYTQERLCIYSQADINSEVVGVMYPGSVGTIVEKGSEFTKITSGEVTGYARNVDLLFGSEADVVAPTISTKSAQVNIDSLPVLAEANATAAKIGTFNKGDNVDVYDETDGFLLVTTQDGNYGYIDKECVNVTYDLSNAMTIAQENDIIAQKKAEEASKAAEEERKRQEAALAAAASSSTGNSTSVGTSTRGAISASAEEIHLLACLIQWEAGWEGYEGKLAVANVVINRMQSSRFAQNTITSVIYSPGQFTGVSDGNGSPSERFSAILAKSNDQLQSGCYQAAVEALNGKNNIGSYLFFISVGKANYSRYSSYMILNNHCFYLY